MLKTLKDLRAHPYANLIPDGSGDLDSQLPMARDFVDECACESFADADEAAELSGAFSAAAIDVIGRSRSPKLDEARLVRFVTCSNRYIAAAAYAGLLTMGLVSYLESAVRLGEVSEPSTNPGDSEPEWHVRSTIRDGLRWMALAPDGRAVFRRPDGAILATAPMLPEPAPRGTSLYVCTSAEARFDDTTLLPDWDGRTPDYDACVTVARSRTGVAGHSP